MVRINLIDPRCLSDQHLVAEYDEILMLVGHARKYPLPSRKPQSYCLGPGHICFFKDKLLYLKKRHERLKKEMRRRGFKPVKTLDLHGFASSMLNDWAPAPADAAVIKKRLIQRIREKPGFYRYCGETKGERFLVGLIRKASL